MSLLSRSTCFALLSFVLTSCGTWNSLQNTIPVRMFDEAASEFLGMFSENTLPASGRPANLEERAKQVRQRGIYAGRVSAETSSPMQGVASR